MKYRCLKEFVSPLQGAHHKVGSVIDFGLDNWSPFVIGLKDNGFIEEIKDEPWKPKFGELYEYISDKGSINSDKEMGTELDESRARIGNKFKFNSGGADKAVEWLKAFKVLREDTKGFKPDWKNPDQDKFSVFYDHTDKYFGVVNHCDTQAELIIFATEADVDKSISAHFDLWKIFFGIGEEE